MFKFTIPKLAISVSLSNTECILAAPPPNTAVIALAPLDSLASVKSSML